MVCSCLRRSKAAAPQNSEKHAPLAHRTWGAHRRTYSVVDNNVFAVESTTRLRASAPHRPQRQKGSLLGSAVLNVVFPNPHAGSYLSLRTPYGCKLCRLCVSAGMMWIWFAPREVSSERNECHAQTPGRGQMNGVARDAANKATLGRPVAGTCAPQWWSHAQRRRASPAAVRSLGRYLFCLLGKLFSGGSTEDTEENIHCHAR